MPVFVVEILSIVMQKISVPVSYFAHDDRSDFSFIRCCIADYLGTISQKQRFCVSPSDVVNDFAAVIPAFPVGACKILPADAIHIG